ncbi:SDR family oxidoreductase [Laspinema sp. D1]|uniref:SDR family oxidoreductase n=1 Tax=Laspinema palackyanum D2a TaxID=2953684 RepID=A0ABT2MMW5_9CYAN|nr:SDR family oxidoreductase [Laspinema sp. D2a]
MLNHLEKSLAGRVALVTGAGRGIGAATARQLAQLGASVVLVSRSAEQLEEVREAIATECSPEQVLVYPADVSSEAQTQEVFDQAIATFGRVDILINNAGMVQVTDFTQIELTDWERVMAVNVTGIFLYCREFFRRAIAQSHGGAIVNVASLSGVRGPDKFPGFTSYITSKYGVVGITDSLAVEGKPHGIRVNSVSPGAVDTALLKQAAPFLKTQTTPDDVARTIVFLADDYQAKCLTGANLEIFSNA